MIDIAQKKEQIISFLKDQGPSLPVRIAKKISMEPVFASAILSELLNEKRIRMSHMKIGASPLYLIPGKEQQLEEHIDNLKSVEKEAYLKLKNDNFLEDEKEEPAIRVALRNLKDFAAPFNFQEKGFWRYIFIPEEEIIQMISKPHKRRIEEGEKPFEERILKKVELVKIAQREEVSQPREENKIEPIFEETDAEFLKEVKEYLTKKDISLVKKIQSDKREVVAKISIKSTFGKIHFLLIAKNKKSIIRDEINSALQRASYNQMPCIYLIRKEPQKSIQKLIENNHLIKIEVM